MNVFAIGASKNIGYFAGLRLLSTHFSISFQCRVFANFSYCSDQGATITYLLRSPNAFDNDAEMLHFIKEGKVNLVRGDGLDAESIRNGWAKALEVGNGKVDVVLFTLGTSHASPIFLETSVLTGLHQAAGQHSP